MDKSAKGKVNVTTQEGDKELEKLVHLALCDSGKMCALCLCRERASNRVNNFSLVSKHLTFSSSVRGEAWTLDETLISQHFLRND